MFFDLNLHFLKAFVVLVPGLDFSVAEEHVALVDFLNFPVAEAFVVLVAGLNFSVAEERFALVDLGQ